MNWSNIFSDILNITIKNVPLIKPVIDIINTVVSDKEKVTYGSTVEEIIPILDKLNKESQANILDKLISSKSELQALHIGYLNNIEDSYKESLKVKTTPILDGVYKFMRPFISLVSLLMGFYNIHIGGPPEITLTCLAPSSIYNIVKGKGFIISKNSDTN